MPVWLTLLGAIFGTVGFFAVLYGVVIAIVEARRAKARPRLGISPGENPGILDLWLTWDPDVFAVQNYRWRVSHSNPDGALKESTFTVTYDTPLKTPSLQPVELPAYFRELLESKAAAKNAIVTIEARFVDELCLAKTYTLSNIRKIYLGQKGRAPSALAKQKVLGQDPPTVLSLDYSELQVRRKKLKDLEAAAKAKAAKAAAKPAAAPASAATAAAPAAAPKAAPAAAAKPAPQDQPVTATKPVATTKPVVN